MPSTRLLRAIGINGWAKLKHAASLPPTNAHGLFEFSTKGNDTMLSTPLRVIAPGAAKADNVEQVRTILMEVVEPTRRESG